MAVEKLEHSYLAGGNIKSYNPFERSLKVSLEVSLHLSYYLGILPSYLPRRNGEVYLYKF